MNSRLRSFLPEDWQASAFGWALFAFDTVPASGPVFTHLAGNVASTGGFIDRYETTIKFPKPLSSNVVKRQFIAFADGDAYLYLANDVGGATLIGDTMKTQSVLEYSITSVSSSTGSPTVSEPSRIVTNDRYVNVYRTSQSRNEWLYFVGSPVARVRGEILILRL